jgi:VIT1/CCC1 family predicted Fe2+/Mn2+ transporter
VKLGAAVPDWQRAHHASVDPHRKTAGLPDLILGGQDGIVAVLGALLGVAAASSSGRLVVAVGLATAFADTISMAAVAYTSMVAQADVYRSERDREYRHIRQVPTLEEAEVRDIYARKGFTGPLLDQIVAKIVANADAWVSVMLSEEHHLRPVSRRQAMRSAVIVGMATLGGALLPVLPFFILSVRAATWTSAIVAAGALFGIGAYKARLTTGKAWRSGLEMAIIGVAAALVGWGIGAAFGVQA